MDITVERIVQLIKSKKIAEATFAEDIGMGRNTVNNWKGGRSKTYLKKVDEIADYFGVSVDYLLGRTDNPAPPRLNADNAIIVQGDYVGPVTEDERVFVEQVLKAYREQQKHDKS